MVIVNGPFVCINGPTLLDTLSTYCPVDDEWVFGLKNQISCWFAKACPLNRNSLVSLVIFNFQRVSEYICFHSKLRLKFCQQLKKESLSLKNFDCKTQSRGFVPFYFQHLKKNKLHSYWVHINLHDLIPFQKMDVTSWHSLHVHQHFNTFFYSCVYLSTELTTACI